MVSIRKVGSKSINAIAILFSISLVISLIFLIPEVVFIILMLAGIIGLGIATIIWDHRNTIISGKDNTIYRY